MPDFASIADEHSLQASIWSCARHPIPDNPHDVFAPLSPHPERPSGFGTSHSNEQPRFSPLPTSPVTSAAGLARQLNGRETAGTAVNSIASADAGQSIGSQDLYIPVEGDVAIQAASSLLSTAQLSSFSHLLSPLRLTSSSQPICARLTPACRRPTINSAASPFELRTE